MKSIFEGRSIEDQGYQLNIKVNASNHKLFPFSHTKIEVATQKQIRHHYHSSN